MKNLHINNLYVLRSIPYRDHSSILSILTPEDDVLRVIFTARKSGKKGTIQPFQRFSAKIKGRSELKTLSQIDNIQHIHLTGYKLWAGLYINELIEKLSRESSKISSLHKLYQETIMNLAQKPLAPVVRWFELHFLKLLGYGIDWDLDDNLFLRPENGQWLISNKPAPDSISMANLKKINDLSIDEANARKHKKAFYLFFLSIIPGNKISSYRIFSKK